jgi:hypothetical protein
MKPIHEPQDGRRWLISIYEAAARFDDNVIELSRDRPDRRRQMPRSVARVVTAEIKPSRMRI